MRILPDAYARKQFADLSAGLTQRERGTRSNFSEPALLLTVRAMPATAANSTFCSERVANSSKQPLHAHALAVNALARFRPSESKMAALRSTLERMDVNYRTLGETSHA